MVAKHWKKFEQSAGFCKLKLKFRQLVGKEPSFRLDIELNTKNFHGWVLVPELIQSHDIVYSIGICDDIAFELALIKQKKCRYLLLIRRLIRCNGSTSKLCHWNFSSSLGQYPIRMGSFSFILE